MIGGCPDFYNKNRFEDWKFNTKNISHLMIGGCPDCKQKCDLESAEKNWKIIVPNQAINVQFAQEPPISRT